MVFVAASFAFALLQLAPGDPFSGYYQNPDYTPEMVSRLRAQYGADEPIMVQYLKWLKNVAAGNLGDSAEWKRPVTTVIANALPNTLLLMSLALAASILLGVLLGQWQALRANRIGDRVASAVAFVVYSMPEFWLAMLLMLVFAGWLGWFPTSGVRGDLDMYMDASERAVERLRRLVLPWASLTLVGTAVFARFHRAAMRDVIDEPFVANARARGLPEHEVVRHARRAALTPVVTLGGLYLPALVGGAVFVETVFSWNGMGSTMVRAVQVRDYPVVSAIVIVGSAATVVGSLVADLLRETVDPRLRAR